MSLFGSVSVIDLDEFASPRVEGVHFLHDVAVVVHAHTLFMGDGIMTTRYGAIGHEQGKDILFEIDAIRVARIGIGLLAPASSGILLDRWHQRLVLATGHGDEQHDGQHEKCKHGKGQGMFL